jgi:hypothetical protein
VLGVFLLSALGATGCADDGKDGDSVVGNEYQSLSIANDVLSLSGDPQATLVDLGIYRDDADADPTNESQSLSDVLIAGLDADGSGMVNLGPSVIGGTVPHEGAALDVQSTTGALLLPRMSTAQRDLLSPALGMLVFNTDVMEFQGYGQETSVILELAEYEPYSIPRSIVEAFWIMHQSFITTEAAPIIAIAIMTDVDAEMPGIFSILEGDGTTGAVLHSQAMTYLPCDTGVCSDSTCTSVMCETEFQVLPAFDVAAGASYTLRFEATTAGSLSTWTSGFDPYDGGQVYQNATAISTEDMHLRIESRHDAWVSLQSP